MRKLFVIMTLVLVAGALGRVGFCQDQINFVEDLYARLLDNYGKIKDMKAVIVTSGNQPSTGQMEITHTATDNYYYKAPRMSMTELYQNKNIRWVLKGDKVRARKMETGKVLKRDFRVAEFTGLPEDVSFAERMIEFFKKHQVTELVSNPEPGVYEIKSTPKDPLAETKGHIGMFVEVLMDANKGVLRKMTFHSKKYDYFVTGSLEWEKFEEVLPGIYYPTFVRSIVRHPDFRKPEETRFSEPTVSTEHIELKNVQVNTGLKRGIFKP